MFADSSEGFAAVSYAILIKNFKTQFITLPAWPSRFILPNLCHHHFHYGFKEVEGIFSARKCYHQIPKELFIMFCLIIFARYVFNVMSFWTFQNLELPSNCKIIPKRPRQRFFGKSVSVILLHFNFVTWDDFASGRWTGENTRKGNDKDSVGTKKN